MDEKFRNNLERALQVKLSMGKQFVTIDVNHDWTIRVYCHPDEDFVHQAVAAVTPLVGRMEKTESGGSFDFQGKNEVFTATVVTPQKCEIVGRRIERKPIMKTIETGDFEEVEILVTDCDLKKGRVKLEEIIPLEVGS